MDRHIRDGVCIGIGMCLAAGIAFGMWMLPMLVRCPP